MKQFFISFLIAYVIEGIIVVLFLKKVLKNTCSPEDFQGCKEPTKLDIVLNFIAKWFLIVPLFFIVTVLFWPVFYIEQDPPA